MQQAAYGIFKKGQIILNEPVNAPDNTEIVVVFLDSVLKYPPQDKNKLLDLFTTLGAWEDSRDADEIIDEIMASRTSKKEDIVL